jgi:hypothetical protein
MGLIVPFVLSLSVSMLAMMSKTSLVMADQNLACWKRPHAAGEAPSSSSSMPPPYSLSIAAHLESMFCPSSVACRRFSMDAFFGFFMPSVMTKILFRASQTYSLICCPVLTIRSFSLFLWIRSKLSWIRIY